MFCDVIVQKGSGLQLIYQFYSPKGLQKHKNISNSSRLVLEEADKLGIKWHVIPGTQIIELTYKGITTSYYHQVPASTTALAKYATNNKSITTNLLKNNGVSVPHGFRIKRDRDEKYISSVFDALQKPLVVKPSNGTWGENITVNVTDFDSCLKAIDYAFEYSGKKKESVIVEEMFQGTEYRILATREKIIGVLYRRPASVLGDGKSSIKKLIKKKNQNPIRDVKGGRASHLKIRMDKRMLKLLQETGKDFSYVPKLDERVYLRRVSNISQGGDAIDVTDKIHPSVAQIALQAIRAIPGLSFAGIDFLTQDITKKQTSDTYTIIEINDSPGFDIHDFPYKGKNRNAAREFIHLMFPDLAKL